MKTCIALSAVVLCVTLQSRADIIAGPITNPANGHDYYLLSPEGWPAAESEAKSLGGTLAIVRSESDQKWIYSTFGSYGGGLRSLWIGLHRVSPGGAFAWVNDSPVNYTNWFAGEPNNLGGNETCVEMRGDGSAPGTWNDAPEEGLKNGVVEVFSRISITDSQRELTGDWYESGRTDHPCHIAETKDGLYAINEMNNAGRIIFDSKGLLFVVPWAIHGEVVEDKILWSNGTWWSHKPMDYPSDEKVSTEAQ